MLSHSEIEGLLHRARFIEMTGGKAEQAHANVAYGRVVGELNRDAFNVSRARQWMNNGTTA